MSYTEKEIELGLARAAIEELAYHQVWDLDSINGSPTNFAKGVIEAGLKRGLSIETIRIIIDEAPGTIPGSPGIPTGRVYLVEALNHFKE